MYKTKKYLTPLTIINNPIIFKNCNDIKIKIIKRNIDDIYEGNDFSILNNIENEKHLDYFIKLAKQQENLFTNKVKPWDSYVYEVNNSAAVIAYDDQCDELLGWMNINFQEIYYDNLYKKAENKDNYKFYIAIINNIAISNYIDNKEKVIDNMMQQFKKNLLKNIYLHVYNKSCNIIEYKMVSIDVYCIYIDIYNSIYFKKNYYTPEPNFDINHTLESVYFTTYHYHTLEPKSNHILFNKNIKYKDKMYSLSEHIFYKFIKCNEEHLLKYIKQKLLDIWLHQIEINLKNY